MYCKYCGSKVEENAKFCPNCGKEVSSSNDNLKVTNEDEKGMVKEEKTNVWFAILSFLIPLAGLIIFLVKKDKDPKTAKASGICAIVGFLIETILSFLLFFLIINGGLRLTESIIDKSSNTFDKVIDKGEEAIDRVHDDMNDSAIYDWDDYEFMVNGKEVELPCLYSQLKNITGFSAKSSDENSVLSSNQYAMVNMYKNDEFALSIEVLNDTRRDAKYMDSKVTRIYQTDIQVKNGADKIIFPGNLAVGDEITESKIKQLFGEPTDINSYSSDGYNSVTYKYNENIRWTTTNYFEIKVVNGVISEMTLDNRNDD